jgi:hypothetical protein
MSNGSKRSLHMGCGEALRGRPKPPGQRGVGAATARRGAAMASRRGDLRGRRPVR